MGDRCKLSVWCLRMAGEQEGRPHTSYPLPASSSRGTAGPSLSSSLPSRYSRSIRPARKGSIVSKAICHLQKHCCRYSPVHRRRGRVVAGQGGARRGGVNGLLVEHPGRRAVQKISRSASQHHSRLSFTHHRRCAQHHLGAARTGTFWRFAGRASPSPTPALAALRLAALSISSVFVVA